MAVKIHELVEKMVGDVCGQKITLHEESDGEEEERQGIKRDGAELGTIEKDNSGRENNQRGRDLEKNKRKKYEKGNDKGCHRREKKREAAKNVGRREETGQETVQTVRIQDRCDA